MNELPAGGTVNYTLGLDLGQSNDPTALAILQRVRGPREDGKEDTFNLSYLKRYPLGTGYPAIVEDMKLIMERPEIAKKEPPPTRIPIGIMPDASSLPPLEGPVYGPELAVDETGVGKPILDMMRTKGLKPVGITITGGNAVNESEGGFTVPKRDLVTSLEILFQSQRLKVAKELPLADAFNTELQNFTRKQSASGHDSYEALRSGDHDDLVLAVGIAAWLAQNKQIRSWGFERL